MEKSNENKHRKAIRIAISVLIAMAVWVYVDSVQAREVTVKIRNIPVEFTGEETTLADNGLMLLSGYDKTVTLNLSGPRNVLYRLHRDEVRIVADTSSITGTGTQTLSYRVIYPDNISSASLTVTSASAYTVTVSVGELYTKDVEIRCTVTGAPADGYTAGDLVLDPQVLTLRGQRDDLVNISYARISIDLNRADTTVTSACEFTLYDYNDIEISNDKIRPVTKLIQATVPIRTTKEVPLTVNFVEATGSTLATASYTISPQTVTLIGSKDVLAGIEELVVGSVYLQDLGDEQTMIFPVTPPDGTELAPDTPDNVSVAIRVTGVSEKTVETTQINLTNTPAGFTAASRTDSLSITLRGLATEIAAVTGENVRVTADLSNCTSSGTHTVPVSVNISGYGNVGIKGSYQIVVELTGG